MGEIVEWRGPSPHHFVMTPDFVSLALREISPALTYGWGAIPVEVVLGATTFTTSLFPRGHDYAVPLKLAVRSAEGVSLGDRVHIAIRVRT